jgi:hypothetical protein
MTPEISGFSSDFVSYNRDEAMQNKQDVNKFSCISLVIYTLYLYRSVFFPNGSIFGIA